MNNSKIERLRELQELLKSKIISQSEFDEMKNKILNDSGVQEDTNSNLNSETKVSHRTRNIILSILAVLIVLGGAIGGTTYYFSNKASNTEKSSSVGSSSTKKSLSVRSSASSNTSENNSSVSMGNSSSTEAAASSTDADVNGPMTESDAIKLIGKAGIGTADAELMPTSNGKFVFRKTQSQGQVVEVEPDNMSNWTEAYVTLKDQDAHVISDQRFSRN